VRQADRIGPDVALEMDEPLPGDISDLSGFDRMQCIAAREHEVDAVCPRRVGGVELRPVGPVQTVGGNEIGHAVSQNESGAEAPPCNETELTTELPAAPPNAAGLRIIGAV